MEHFTPAKVSKHLTPKNLALIIAGIVVIILLASSVFIVGQAERAVITRFGRYVGTRHPGLQFKIPFVERSHIVNTGEVRAEQFGFRTVRAGAGTARARHFGEATMLTGDLNIVEVEWIVQYRIADARAWTFNVMDRVPTIRDVSRSVINQFVGDRAIMDVMVHERSAIESEARVLMSEFFNTYGLGIEVVTVQLQNIGPPAGVQHAFEDVNMAIQDMERLISDGMRAFNEAIPRAHGEAARMVQVAQGYAVERVNRAHGDVARFNAVLDEYLMAPAVTRRRLYYEMMEEVFRNMEGTVLVDHNLRNFLPLLNLDGQR
ncbi:MAG: FtsH protease activity modulator HflK [Treponema sp.]|nr:FtsH protease activity modulator HflK [Treponema sp.]